MMTSNFEAVTTKPTYAKERNMRGGCRDKAICSKRFVGKEGDVVGKIREGKRMIEQEMDMFVEEVEQ